MSTLYLRNVPDAVVERLKKTAAEEGTSVNAVAVRELEANTRRKTNAELLDALGPGAPGITRQDILDAIDEGRREHDEKLFGGR